MKEKKKSSLVLGILSIRSWFAISNRGSCFGDHWSSLG